MMNFTRQKLTLFSLLALLSFGKAIDAADNNDLTIPLPSWAADMGGGQNINLNLDNKEFFTKKSYKDLIDNAGDAGNEFVVMFFVTKPDRKKGGLDAKFEFGKKWYMFIYDSERLKERKNLTVAVTSEKTGFDLELDHPHIRHHRPTSVYNNLAIDRGFRFTAKREKDGTYSVSKRVDPYEIVAYLDSEILGGDWNDADATEEETDSDWEDDE